MPACLLSQAGLGAKLLDDTKVLCTMDAARDSPLQLTGLVHALTAISSMMSDMHVSAQLGADAEQEGSDRTKP